MSGPDDDRAPGEPAPAQRALEDAVRERETLRMLGVELRGSTVGSGGVVLHLQSSVGDHDVEVRRPNWAQLDPGEIANFVARKVANEIQWRRSHR